MFARSTRTALVCAAVAYVSGCGPGVVVTTAGPTELRAALYASSEELTVTPLADRSRLYDALGAVAADEAVRAEKDAPVLFPIAVEQQILAAPFNPNLDLLKPPASAPDVDLIDGQEKWSDDQQTGLLGASERELGTLVARSLLAQWKVTTRVTVVRSSGFPYAAAFVDGQLRLNPAVLYLAVAHAAPPEAAQTATVTPTPERLVAAPTDSAVITQAAAVSPSSATPFSPALEVTAPISPAAPSSFPVSPLETAAALVAAGLFGSWALLRRR